MTPRGLIAFAVMWLLIFSGMQWAWKAPIALWKSVVTDAAVALLITMLTLGAIYVLFV